MEKARRSSAGAFFVYLTVIVALMLGWIEQMYLYDTRLIELEAVAVALSSACERNSAIQAGHGMRLAVQVLPGDGRCPA